MYATRKLFILFCVVRSVFCCLVEPDMGSGDGFEFSDMCSQNVISNGLFSGCADCSFLDGTSDLGEAVNVLSQNAASILTCIPDEYDDLGNCPPIIIDVLGPDSAIESCQDLVGTLVDESLSDSDLISENYGLNQVYNCSSNVLDEVLGNSLATIQNMLEYPGTPCTLFVDYQYAVESLINSNCGFNCADSSVEMQVQKLLLIMKDFLDATLELECGEYQSCVSNCADTNGECVEEDTELVCYCPEGYVANDIYECEDVNECDDNPCVAEATCMNSIGSFQCICPPTTFGDGINACAAADFCDGVICQNNGTCLNEPTNFLCICDEGWQGQFCEMDVKECLDPMACLNMGFCMEEMGSFSCECPPGFQGDICEDDINECDESPCDVNAFCSNTGGSFVCTCDGGFTGSGLQCFSIITYEICDPYILAPSGHERVFFLLPINFDGIYYDSVWITENGVLIFSDDSTLSSSFDMQESEGLPYIAPFWDNYELDENVLWSLEENLEGIYSCEVQRMIDRLFEVKSVVFNPKTVLQITWYRVSISPESDFGDKRNTYQCNLLSDGYDTYLFFSYQPGSILFDPIDRNPMLNNAIIGYKNPDGITAVSNIQTMWYQPDTDTNTGKLGEYIYMISYHEADIEISNCLNWVDNEQEFPVESWLRFISCPWSLDFAFSDWRYSQIPVNRRSLNRLGVDFTDYPLTYSDFVCYQSNQNFIAGSGVRCCYHAFSGIFYSGPLASHFERRQVLSNFVFPLSRLETSFDVYRDVEINGLKYCCADINSVYCYIYHTLRPPANILFYRPIRPLFWAFGDPHINTLSGYEYTFNGLGEYFAIYIEGGLQMQGRAELQLNADGDSSGATVFTRFALYDPVSSTNIQVFPEPSSTDVVITFNGTMANFTDDFGEPSFFSEGIQYTKTSNTTFQITFNESVSISFFTIVTSTSNVMSFTMRVTENFNEDVVGLVGDFIFPNGTSLNIPDITLSRPDILNGTFDQESIFPFGESWRITESESLFEYEIGEDYDTFNPPSHIPPFLTNLWDSSSPERRTEVIDFCDGTLGCIYDLLVTNNSALAGETQEIETDTREEEERARNTLPVITISEDSLVNGTVRFNAETMEYLRISFNISDADDDDLTTSFDNQLAGFSSGNIDDDDLFLHWNGNDSLVLDADISDGMLSITVSDGIAPVTVNIPVRICLCKNNATCMWDILALGTADYGVVACECPQAYAGLLCEDDRDECSPNPCVGNCTDMVIPNSGFTCGPCPAPLVLQGDGVTCSDPDQCADGTDNCDSSSNCINLPNGFECVCDNGFQLNNDNTSCSDIDECQESNVCPLNSNCTNNPGNFSCVCHPGFNQSNNCLNINECDANPCPENTTVCVDTSGSYICNCLDGYEKPAGGTPTSACVDTNECENTIPICAGSVCENSIGGFTCNCNDTYVRLNPTVCLPSTCNDMDDCPPGKRCNQNEDGQYECVCINGRVLFEGVCQRRATFRQALITLFQSAFLNLNSPESIELIRQFKEVYSSILEFLELNFVIVIKGLEPGSTIVIFDLISNSTEDDNIEQLDLLLGIIGAIQTDNFNTSLFLANPTIEPVNTTNVCDDLPPTSMTFDEILSSGAAILSTACNPNSIGLTVDLCLLENAGLGAEDMVIGGPSQFPISEADVDDDCRPRVVFTSDGNASALFLLFDLQVCNPDVTMDNETIEYSYRVGRISSSPLEDSNIVIQRFLDVCGELTCIFNRSYEVWSDPVKPMIRKISFGPEEAEGEFDITMELFRDASCTMPLSEGDEVMVSDSIYFKVDHPGPNEDAFTLQASECWATLSSDPADSYRYDIIDNGCASTEDSGAISVIANYNDTFVKAGFESFVWTNVSDNLQEIYVHCMVGLCLTGSDCGQIECGKRKRRAINNDIEKHLITLGPLTPYDPCHEHCEQICTLDVDQPICSCYHGYELSSNGITCYQTKLLETIKETEKQSKDLFFYGAVIVISVMTSILAILLWRK